MENGEKQDGSGERDTRFDAFRKNPIYRRVPKNQKRVQIDSRFKSMFHDEQFKLTYKVDKRGRPVNTTTNENLKQYYELEDGDDEEGNISDSKLSKSEDVKSKVDADEDVIKVKPGEDDSDSEGSESDESKEDDDDESNIEGNISEAQIRKKDKSVKITKDIKKKLHDTKVDYARGEADFASEESESDDSSSSEDEEEVADISHAWGELDRDAERVEDSTSRLALCNMDWDRVKAVDLMVLFHSFLPSNGLLKSVTIYPSEFGKERLSEEEIHGPRELRVEKPVDFPEEVENGSDDSEGDDDNDMAPGDEEDEEGGSYHMEKLRKYQLNRLKYYYALLEFDSAETAEKVYTECDGMEYESSATHVDLRFVPEDMEFDENDIKDRCDKLADGEKYRPRFFTTTALQQAKVDLTWDETDPLRKELTERVFNPKDEIDDEDLKAYLASSSESEDEDVNENDADGSGAENDTASNPDPMAKYRALLEGIEDSEKKKKERDVEMEITWGVGLKAKTEKMVKEKLEKQAAANLTPWEEILAKKKEKSKKKRHDKRKGAGTEVVGSASSSDEDEDQPFSDDDVDVDMNDPFFEEELKTKTKKSSKQKSSKKDEIIPKPGEKPADKAALELLLMDDEDHKHHFNLKNIIDRETDSKSKKKRLRKKDLKNKVQKKDTVDNFELDVADDRFSALFSSHLFNVDPSDPNYKNTNAMKTIVSEKQKRRLAAVSADEVSKMEKSLDSSQDQSEAKKSKTSAELSVLVKSIKRNTDNLKNRHKNKPKQW